MKYFLILTLSLSLFSCSSESKDDTEKTKVNGGINTQNKSKITNIQTLFDSKTFDDSKKVELLKELQVCNPDNKVTGDYMNPTCSPEFFNLMPFVENTPIENAFMVQIKAKTNGFPLRRLILFVREKDELVKVNGFVANLIGTQKSPSKHDDLLLRFNDKDQGQDVFYNCLFAWNGTTYKYKSVEVIEGSGWGGKVKAELKDSISKEVEKDIIKNKMIF